MAKEQVQVHDVMDGFRFFGEDEIHPKTHRPSGMKPSWFFSKNIEDKVEEVRKAEHSLASGAVAESRLPRFKALLAQKKARLQEMKNSCPKVTALQEVELKKYHALIGKTIAETMFNREDDKRGVVDIQEEARREREPIIAVRDVVYSLAIQSGAIITEIKGDAMITRTAAVNMWQMIGKLIGENTNAEILRQDDRFRPKGKRELVEA
jgi:hypothetical protein